MLQNAQERESYNRALKVQEILMFVSKKYQQYCDITKTDNCNNAYNQAL